MPRRDGTGPMGQGSMTGGGFGSCSKQGNRSNFCQGFGRGLRRFFGVNSKLQGEGDLQNHIKNLETELELTKSELSRLSEKVK